MTELHHPAEPKFGEWLPIESAPKDGTEILTFPHYYVTHWLGGLQTWRGHYNSTTEGFDRVSWKITHWMPLPPPPEPPK